jgi:hypothetical protein
VIVQEGLAVIGAMAVVYWSAVVMHFITCRLTAERCPACGERWWTEVVGEWEGEEWRCAECNHYWEVPL